MIQILHKLIVFETLFFDVSISLIVFSLHNGSIQLINKSDSECKVEILKPSVVRDQGVWNFMIIQGSNIEAKWYLHRVTLNFIDKDGIMLTTLTPLAREGTSGT